MFNITGGTFISLDPQNPIGLLPIDILTPVQMTTSGPTLERLQHHKAVLEAIGITDLAQLGSLTLSGSIVPQVGITLPPAANISPYEAQPTAFQWAYRISPDGTALQKIGGTAQLLKAIPLPDLSAIPASPVTPTTPTIPGGVIFPGGPLFPGGGFTPVHPINPGGLTPIYPASPSGNGFGNVIGASPLPIFRMGGTMTATAEAATTYNGSQLVDAYIAADTLILEDNTTIILKYPNRFLTIIAEHLIVGKNVTITWDRPSLTVPPKASRGANGLDAFTPNGLWGETGGNGGDGANGANYAVLGSKGALDGVDAPELEIWTLDLQGKPAIDLRGQDANQGQTGGDGGTGGSGSTGKASTHDWIGFCKSGPGSGGDGGAGGKAGNGGAGGNGGHGGRFQFYAPQPVLNAYSTGFFVTVDGGAGGAGGLPGLPGDGGRGGNIGDSLGCAPVNRVLTAGQNGARGATGVQGPNGHQGEKYDDAIHFENIDADEFRRKLLSPALIRLDPQIAKQGETVRAYGQRFTATDILLIDNIQVAKTPFNDTQFTFVVPSLSGGRKTVQLKQTDGTLSNRNTLAIYPTITDMLPARRVRPGTTVTLKGSGFSPSAVVTANGQMVSDVRYVNSSTLEFTIVRPSDIQPNPSGESMVLQVFVPEVPPSNTLAITLDTVRMVVLGDSVMWGQGLTENQKMHYLVSQVLQQREGNIGVYYDTKAHSGAIIGISNAGSLPALNGEVPTDFPTIVQQVNLITDAPETVDFVLLNGGINDVNARTILSPVESEASLMTAIEQHCFTDMKTLLEMVTSKFPNAKIIVTGYYPMISDSSDLTFLTVFLTFMGLTLAQLGGAIAGGILSPVLAAVIIKRCAIFAKESEKAFQRAIDHTNQLLISNRGEPTRRVFLAQPEFDRDNAALAPRPWLFGLTITGTPEDTSVAADRSAACDMAGPERTDIEICKRASMGHPNAAGAQAYANEIVALLYDTVFPDGFLWGAATAAYQVEGNITNNDWHIFTTSPAIHKRVQDIGGIAGMNIDLQPPGDAVQHGDLKVLKEDLDRAKVLGLNAYRFSIEWSRIEPTRGNDDPAAFQYYDAVIDEMLNRGLKPIVTLNHLTLPLWVLTPARESFIDLVPLGDQGFNDSLHGWENPETVDVFVAFVNRVVTRYKDKVDTWITLNEPVGSMIGVGYFAGIWPPGFVGQGGSGKVAYFNLLRAHVRAYDAIKLLYSGKTSKVGVAHNMMYTRLTQAGAGLGGINIAAKNQFAYFYNEHFLNSVLNTEVDTAIEHRQNGRVNVPSQDFYGLAEAWTPKLDFIGLNYYRSVYAYHDVGVALAASYSGGKFDNDLQSTAADQHNLLNPLGWEIYPKGIYWILKELKDTYGLPVLITENGMPEVSDHMRAPFIVGHMAQVLRAIQEGVQVDGYLHWSLVDNFEWHENYHPRARFGLFSIDRNAMDANGTCLRHITEGALALQYIIAEKNVRQAIERFGCITPSAYAVSAPMKTAGSTWEGSTSDGVGVNVYLSRLSNGNFLGMIFFQDSHRWHRLEQIEWAGNQLRFSFLLPDGTRIAGSAAPSGKTLNGSFTGYPQSRTWQVTRQSVDGMWNSDNNFPEYINFHRLEGSFSDWQGKFLSITPYREWTSNTSVQRDTTTLHFDVGAFGTFESSMVGDAAISGQIQLLNIPAGIKIPWNAQRLPDDLPF